MIGRRTARIAIMLVQIAIMSGFIGCEQRLAGKSEGG